MQEDEGSTSHAFCIDFSIVFEVNWNTLSPFHIE